ncbi:MAG: OmpH family outer membrane protein [Phycisphaerales bacterium]|nr:OmpH family outer membrane protein [Phycisphaerales bacterium]
MTTDLRTTSRSRRLGASSPATMLASAGLLLLGAAALLLAATMPTKPAVMASLDLERVYNSLNRQAAADAELQAMADEMQKGIEVKRVALDELKADLDSFQPGSADHKRLLGEIEFEALRFNALVEFNRQKIEARRAELIRRIYGEIKESVKTLAEQNGIDAVYLDDSLPPIEPADPKGTMQQISARRMLYSSQSLDITDALISFMNGKAPQ